MKNTNTKNIITEEVKKFLNESYTIGGDNFNFKQQVPRAYFYNYENYSNDYDVTIDQSNIIATWQITFWLNDMGIENFTAEIEKVEGIYMVEMFDKQTDELKQQTEKNIAEIQWSFQTDENAVIEPGKSLYIKDLTFDFIKKSCTPTFYVTSKY
jgi:hypothetical protein